MDPMCQIMKIIWDNYYMLREILYFGINFEILLCSAIMSPSVEQDNQISTLFWNQLCKYWFLLFTHIKLFLLLKNLNIEGIPRIFEYWIPEKMFESKKK